MNSTCSTHSKATPQHDGAPSVPHSWDVVYKLPLFPPKEMMIIMTQNIRFRFKFNLTSEHVLKKGSSLRHVTYLWWWLDLHVLLILVNNFWNRRTLHQRTFGNCAQGSTKLLKVHSSLPDISCLMFSKCFHDVRQPVCLRSCFQTYLQVGLHLTQML